jgi:hypothetical protein
VLEKLPEVAESEDNVVAPVTPRVLEKLPEVAESEDNIVAPVTPRVPPIDAFVPTNNFFAIPTPPALVRVPPLVELVASVVFDIPIPPASVIPPVTFVVDAVLLELERIPEKEPVVAPSEDNVVAPITPRVPPIDTSVPTNNFFAIPTPPAVVRVPPFVELVASVVFEIPIPPESVIPPVTLVVDVVVLELEIIPEKLPEVAANELRVVAPVTPRVLEKEPVVADIPANVVAPVTPRVPPTEAFVPTNNFFSIPTPPAVVIVPPLVELVASVVFEIPIPPTN